VENKDVLFVKLNSDGDFVCATRIGGPGDDVGIDVVEGANYYYVAGLWNGGDLFYARFNKTDCSLVGPVRYILSSSDELARAITIRPNSGIPYIAGYTNRAGWTAGDYDGLLVADSGLQDTCYWRSLTPSTNVSVTLSASDYWDDYGNTGITVSSATYNSTSVSTNKTIVCDLLTRVNEERYEDCYISISKNGKVLYIKSKNRQNLSIKIYAPSGKLVYSKDIKDFEGVLNENIKLPSGVYIINVNYGDRKINKRFLVN